MSAWPRTVEELVRAQEQLAEEAPPPFEPADELAFGGCFICFERGPADGPGQKGDRGWAGAALLPVRTRRGMRPLMVHAGWRTDAETAAALVVATVADVRTPESLRQARRVARVAHARRHNGSVNALWLVLGIVFAAVVFGVLTYIGTRWRP